MYNQITNILSERASKPLKVVPAAYPAPNINQFGASIVNNARGLLIGMVLFGGGMLPEGVADSKLTAIFGIYMGGSMLGGALTKTSAFEIYLGRKLVYSAIANNRMPSMDDLQKGFERAGVTLAN